MVCGPCSERNDDVIQRTSSVAAHFTGGTVTSQLQLDQLYQESIACIKNKNIRNAHNILYFVRMRLHWNSCTTWTP